MDDSDVIRCIKIWCSWLYIYIFVLVNLLFEILGRDKKAVNGKVKWILLDEIGKVIISDQVSEENIRKVLAEIWVWVTKQTKILDSLDIKC